MLCDDRMKRFALALALLSGTVHAQNWPQWRGPRLDGTSNETTVPTRWSPTENILWRSELPGSGHASPVVWGDKVFTVSAEEDTQERLLVCLNRNDGTLLWKTAVIKAPLERTHRLNSHASSTPATDGERVFTAFLENDKAVVAAHDFAGKELWLKRVGSFQSVHGFCSSPIIYKDKVIVNCDHDGDGYIVALARADGRELWRIDRPNKTRSYVVPLICEAGGRTQMVLSGSKCVTSYKPDNGELLWIIDGPTEQFVASLVFNARANLFFLTAGYPEHHLLAIKPDGRGNVTDRAVAWRTQKGAAYVPSPISAGDYFLVTSDSGVAHCYDAKSGTLTWQERLGEQHASLVSANGLVYFLNDKGRMNVVRPGPKFERVAQNELGESTFASPAISDGQIFIRGEKSLFCIGQGRQRD
jgi:outer membrane protein assembly factor BamB